MSATVFVVTDACRGCGACLPTCSSRALRVGPPTPGATPLITLEDRCTGCGECMEICPADAFVEVARSLPRAPAAEIGPFPSSGGARS